MKGDIPLTAVCPGCGHQFVGHAYRKRNGGYMTPHAHLRSVMRVHLWQVHFLFGRRNSLALDALEEREAPELRKRGWI